MERKRKRKFCFLNNGSGQEKKKRLVLEPGMKGFFCTCNFRQKECIKEAYNLLTAYSEKIYDVNELQTSLFGFSMIKNGKEDKEERTDDDILNVLSKEINELKAEAVAGLQRKFQVVDTGLDNTIFIQSSIPDILKLLTAIVKDLNETKKQKTRYLIRMLPIAVSCKANLDDIKTKAEILFEQHFTQEPRSFCIIFNRHRNNSLHRCEVIDILAQIISKKNKGNKANLKDPDIAVVVEVIRAICLISIAPQYFTFKKYNLLEICNGK